ncbi:MAG: hypothetical protein R3Y08_03820 [Rikenellaceae bacterium]
MKKSLITAICCLTQVAVASAQTLSPREEFLKRQQEVITQYKENAEKEYEQFLEQRNSDYANFMAQKWELYQTFKGVDQPISPYPQEPVVKTNSSAVLTPVSLPIKKVIKTTAAKKVSPEFQRKSDREVPDLRKLFMANGGSTSSGSTSTTTTPTTKPTTPTPTTPTTPVKKNLTQDPSAPKGFEFEYLGNKLAVGLSSSNIFTLKGTNEATVSNMWKQLSNGSLSQAIDDCVYWKEALNLNDYLYVMMVDSMCDSFLGSSRQNEARLLKTYILNQSGYDAKCARCSQGLVMLLSFEESIYQKRYIKIDGSKYYILDEPKDSDNVYYTFSQKFAEQSKSCSVKIEEEFVVNQNLAQSRVLTSRAYPNISIAAAVDKDLIALYNNYPRCDWEIYAKAPMSISLSNKVLPALRAEIAGKSETEAANMIINFVQTAFAYKTDSDYFGYERSLFVDETFYYPYSDCEDRSILFTNLIQSLLGLDVVLLQYPDHLATAVRFNSDYNGDHMIIGGKKYIICDPTYIGANIGEAMPAYKRVSATIVML